MAVPSVMTHIGVLRGSLYEIHQTPPRTGAASNPPPPPPPPYVVGRAASKPTYMMMPTPGYTGPTDDDMTQPPSNHEGGDAEGLEDLQMKDQEEQTAPDGRTLNTFLT